MLVVALRGVGEGCVFVFGVFYLIIILKRSSFRHCPAVPALTTHRESRMCGRTKPHPWAWAIFGGGVSNSFHTMLKIKLSKRCRKELQSSTSLPPQLWPWPHLKRHHHFNKKLYLKWWNRPPKWLASAFKRGFKSYLKVAANSRLLNAVRSSLWGPTSSSEDGPGWPKQVSSCCNTQSLCK